eukprot:c38984_g1_i1.p1 GENE.c38984_g1_i1~~c38984_g1_i1.p1  ORF type:complete len:896 (+),score=152.59 c38984_g1_i1:53-2740(+)
MPPRAYFSSGSNEGASAVPSSPASDLGISGSLPYSPQRRGSKLVPRANKSVGNIRKTKVYDTSDSGEGSDEESTKILIHELKTQLEAEKKARLQAEMALREKTFLCDALQFRIHNLTAAMVRLKRKLTLGDFENFDQRNVDDSESRRASSSSLGSNISRVQRLLMWQPQHKLRDGRLLNGPFGTLRRGSSEISLRNETDWDNKRAHTILEEEAEAEPEISVLGLDRTLKLHAQQHKSPAHQDPEQRESLETEIDDDEEHLVMMVPRLKDTKSRTSFSELTFLNGDDWSKYVKGEDEETEDEDGESKRSMVLGYITQMSIFLPQRVLRWYARKVIRDSFDQEGKRVSLPEASPPEEFCGSFQGAILYADISGFSLLAEGLRRACNRMSVANRALSDAVGEVLAPLVDIILETGGDIFKFAGDAVFAVYSERDHTTLALATQAACYAATKIIRVCLKHLLTGDNLEVHCGIGAGEVVELNVGGVGNRWEYAIMGPALDQAISCEGEAASGEAFMSHEALLLTQGVVQTEPPPNGSQNVKLTSVTEPTQHGHQVLRQRWQQRMSQLDFKSLHAIYCYAKSYVPAPVLRHLKGGMGVWMADIHFCATIFVRLTGLTYSHIDDVTGIHNAVRMVQRKLNACPGATMCRLIVDDKGLGMLWAVGDLPSSPRSQDFIARAVLTAVELHEALQNKQLSCAVGITAGRVFCGTVGAAARCEYTLHGTQVNLAARLMSKTVAGVLCDEEVYACTKHIVQYGPAISLTVKGKSEPVTAYCAVRLDPKSKLPPLGAMLAEGSPAIGSLSRSHSDAAIRTNRLLRPSEYPQYRKRSEGVVNGKIDLSNLSDDHSSKGMKWVPESLARLLSKTCENCGTTTHKLRRQSCKKCGAKSWAMPWTRHNPTNT